MLRRNSPVIKSAKSVLGMERKYMVGKICTESNLYFTANCETMNAQNSSRVMNVDRQLTMDRHQNSSALRCHGERPSPVSESWRHTRQQADEYTVLWW